MEKCFIVSDDLESGSSILFYYVVIATYRIKYVNYKQGVGFIIA